MMPVTPTYPGVYIQEIPSGVRTLTGVATSITAFVGYTARGPVDKATRIASFGDFERHLGGLHPDSEVSYAVQQFFLNGGADAYVVRVASGAGPAKVTLQDSSGDDVLVVSAISAGAWGNDLRLEVDYLTDNPDSTFNLRVTRFEVQGGRSVPAENEHFRNLSMKSRASAYAPAVVNSGSKLIRLERPEGISFDERGYSLSGKLEPSQFPSLTEDDTIISGVLNGNRPFNLVLVLTDAPPTNVGELEAAVSAAITAAGLADRLKAERADALGEEDENDGEFLRLVSLKVTGDESTDAEHSSVRITPAPSNDLAARLKLGLANGGREREGAAVHRPAPNGTISADLAAVDDNIEKKVIVRVREHPDAPELDSIEFDLSPVPVGPGLAAILQDLLRGIDHPATRQATVRLVGTALQILLSAATPNASVRLSGGGADKARISSSSHINLQQYSLGTGPTFGAQENADLGSDGDPPGGVDLVGSYDKKTGIYALRDVDLFNLLVIPRTTKLADAEAKDVIAKAIALCTERRAFYLVDPDPALTATTVSDWVSDLGTSKNAAVFFPRILAADPLNKFRIRDMPASGAIAGVMARIDSERGIWKAPAGTDAGLRGTQGLSYVLTDPENGILNQEGINCLRSFPTYGRIVWGARTLEGADRMASEWKYIPVRRTALYIEESLYRGTQWVVFEGNDEPLWSQIRLNIGAFMHTLFRKGAFAGSSPREAYLVKCDSETTTQDDINRGIVNILVGFAPLKPAEFVIIQIQQLAGQIET
jgi:uncharacterized protein